MGRGAARKKRRAIARGEIPKEPSALEKTLAESRTPRADNRLIARAARARWNISDADREMVVNRMVNILNNGETSRDMVNAARALISIDKLNIDVELAEKNKSEAIPVESEQTSTSQELREQILREPDYLEYRRQVAASAGNGDTGVVRSVDQPGTLEAGSASD